MCKKMKRVDVLYLRNATQLGLGTRLGIRILSLDWVGIQSCLPTPVVCRSALTFSSLAMEMSVFH